MRREKPPPESNMPAQAIEKSTHWTENKHFVTNANSPEAKNL